MRFIHYSRKTILLVIAVVSVTLISSFIVSSLFPYIDYTPSYNNDLAVPSAGTIIVQGLEIYGGDIEYDSESEKVFVDWGELTLGASKSVTFYVKSTSNVDVKLELNVTNWMPRGLDDYLTLSWNYNGTLLNPSEELVVGATLKVASDGDFIDFLIENEVVSFGFDINIYASGV